MVNRFRCGPFVVLHHRLYPSHLFSLHYFLHHCYYRKSFGLRSIAMKTQRRDACRLRCTRVWVCCQHVVCGYEWARLGSMWTLLWPGLGRGELCGRRFTSSRWLRQTFRRKKKKKAQHNVQRARWLRSIHYETWSGVLSPLLLLQCLRGMALYAPDTAGLMPGSESYEILGTVRLGIDYHRSSFIQEYTYEKHRIRNDKHS